MAESKAAVSLRSFLPRDHSAYQVFTMRKTSKNSTKDVEHDKHEGSVSHRFMYFFHQQRRTLLTRYACRTNDLSL